MATKEDTPQETDGGHHQSSSEPLEHHYRILEEEIQTLRESEGRLRQQYADSQRRERILVRRLAAKEQEMQDYANQISELKSSQAPGPNSLRNALLDPAINILFQKLKLELQATKAKMEETQNELSAWKFTPDSNNGKRLMAKCRLLHQENEELGKMTSNGRLAKLEGDLALQKSFSEEVKKSQSELDDFLQELDEDVEGMQSTIFFLQQELKAAKETIATLETEINSLKSICNTQCVVNGSTNLNKNNSISEMIDVNNLNNDITSEIRTPNLINNGLKHNSSYSNDGNNLLKRTNNTKYLNGDSEILSVRADEQNNDNNITVIKSNNLNLSNPSNNNNNNNNNELTNNISITNKRILNNYDSDSSEYNSNNELVENTKNCNKKFMKKKYSKKQRRSSFLSIDLNDEDSEMAVELDNDNDKKISSPASSNGNVKQILNNTE